MGSLTFKLQLGAIWRLLRAQFLLVVAIAAAIGLLFMSTASAAQPKRVLIVNSFGSTAPPFSFQSTAFKSALVAKIGEPARVQGLGTVPRGARRQEPDRSMG
jgi:hypothetical protein